MINIQGHSNYTNEDYHIITPNNFNPASPQAYYNAGQNIQINPVQVKPSPRVGG